MVTLVVKYMSLTPKEVEEDTWGVCGRDDTRGAGGGERPI
jgi:hypothetical protein